MRKVFEVELGSQSGPCTELALPAAPHVMLAALERLRLEEGELPSWEILRTPACGKLLPYLDSNGSLFDLNALCQQLARLDEAEIAIMEGLAKLECEQGTRPIPLPRLIDMAYSTGYCHFIEGVVTDAQLGRFCAENSFVPEVDDLSDEAFELLDFAKIGQEFLQNEGGVFTEQGYVQRYGEIMQVYGTLDIAPQKPDYTILVQTAGGCEVRLPVPLGNPTGDEPVQCVDCAAPALAGLTGRLGTWDMLAHRMAELEVDGELPKYKALLDAVGCDDICQALSLTDGLDQYAFDPKVREPEDAARVALGIMLPDEEIKLLTPCLNMYQYGQAVLEQGGGELTGYGLIERVDGGPVHSPEQGPAQGGLELM